jgi:hypothetical protein
VPDWLLWVWRAWHRLNLDRPMRGGGFGPMMPGRIPWTTVRDWCEFHDYSADEMAFLDHCLREMDSVFLEWHAAQLKRG